MKKIAVLFHERNNHRNIRSYSIVKSAELWRHSGHDVTFLFGTNRFVEADICFLHIDLSVVPDEYIDFAQKYPIAVNGQVRDIRKTAFSEHLLKQMDDYAGNVIVKTNLNYAGWPEKRLQNRIPSLIYSRLMARLFKKPTAFFSSSDYRIYNGISEVPAVYFEDDNYVVEKFLPEMEGDIYISRNYMFMGGSHQCSKMGSKNPILKYEDILFEEQVDVEPEVVEARRRLNFDYGKFDYCINSGRVILHDVNKTFTWGIPKEKDMISVHLEKTMHWTVYSKARSIKKQLSSGVCFERLTNSQPVFNWLLLSSSTKSTIFRQFS